MYNMATERDTFVLTLAKFTNLTNFKEINEKSIKCIKLLLTLASYHGHLLGSSWYFVIEIMSKLDYYSHLGQVDPLHREREA